MDYDYWATVDDAEDRNVDSTSPLNFNDQDEDYLSTHFLLREIMPNNTEEEYQIVGQRQIRSIKVCK
jgi:hypothetical protein